MQGAWIRLLLFVLILINLMQNCIYSYMLPNNSTSPLYIQFTNRNATIEQKKHRISSEEVDDPSPGPGPGPSPSPDPGVQLLYQENYIELDNGIIKVKLSKPEGSVTKIEYNGIANLLEQLNDESNRGYWDVVWKGEGVTRKKGNLDRFNYMAMADDRQRQLPLLDDRSPERSQTLAYPEAVLLTNPIEPEFKGEVDDKYQYSGEAKDIQVHGWICSNPPTGLWHIIPNNEFRSAGPTKQYLTSHVGPTSLSVLLSTHYSGQELVAKFEDGEPWKKVLGPLFVYANSMSQTDAGDWHQLWDDAKKQLAVEAKLWPYSFAVSDDFPSSEQRGSVNGKLLVYDRYMKTNTSAAKAYVGLAAPGEVGSWQRESKGYQFWTTTDDEGNFTITNIRPGNYNLYAWVPGFIGDYRYNDTLNITAGISIDMGDLVYEHPRDGPILWEIGVPDRSAAEFFIPDPDPKLVNKLYLTRYKFRQYGLWERYTELYPDEDLVYTVNVSNYQNDWFFAQVNRNVNNTYQGTTWKIIFQLDKICTNGTYYLRLALASATSSELQVRINDPHEKPPLFSTGLIGHDNTIARHGIHGLYWLYNVSIPGDKFILGNNTIFLTQVWGLSPWRGILYDYIRLESPVVDTN